MDAVRVSRTNRNCLHNAALNRKVNGIGKPLMVPLNNNEKKEGERLSHGFSMFLNSKIGSQPQAQQILFLVGPTNAQPSMFPLNYWNRGREQSSNPPSATTACPQAKMAGCSVTDTIGRGVVGADFFQSEICSQPCAVRRQPSYKVCGAAGDDDCAKRASGNKIAATNGMPNKIVTLRSERLCMAFRGCWMALALIPFDHCKPNAQNYQQTESVRKFL
jgi:hypothetical protein